MAKVGRNAKANVSVPDPRVPPLDSWPPEGISGRVTTGPFLGDPVVAMRWSPNDSVYLLYLPMEQLFDPDGTLVSETDITDRMGEAGTGIIHDVTRALDVEWSTSGIDFEAAVEWYRRRPITD